LHVLSLVLSDKAGNKRTTSKNLYYDWNYPALSINTPTGHITQTFDLSWTASDANGISGVNVYEGGKLKSTLSSSARNFSFNPAGHTEGAKSISVVVTDNSGKTSTKFLNKTFAHIPPSLGAISYNKSGNKAAGYFHNYSIPVGNLSGGEYIAVSLISSSTSNSTAKNDGIALISSSSEFSGSSISINYRGVCGNDQSPRYWFLDQLESPKIRISITDKYGKSSSHDYTLGTAVWDCQWED